jgi:hypothetical protein
LQKISLRDRRPIFRALGTTDFEAALSTLASAAAIFIRPIMMPT